MSEEKSIVVELKLVQSKKMPVGTTYRDLFLSALNTPPAQGGFSPSLMRKRIKFIDKLEESKGSETVELSAAEVAELKACMESTQWGIVDKAILEACDYIAGL